MYQQRHVQMHYELKVYTDDMAHLADVKDRMTAGIAAEADLEIEEDPGPAIVNLYWKDEDECRIHKKDQMIANDVVFTMEEGRCKDRALWCIFCFFSSPLNRAREFRCANIVAGDLECRKPQTVQFLEVPDGFFDDVKPYFEFDLKREREEQLAQMGLEDIQYDEEEDEDVTRFLIDHLSFLKKSCFGSKPGALGGPFSTIVFY